MRIPALAAAAALAFLAGAGPAAAHGGGLDRHGCHNNAKEGVYECHRGPLAGHAYRSRSDMLRALEGVSGGTTSSGAPSPSGYQEYDRDLYDHWTDHDGDCVNARHEVLQAESRKPVRMSKDGCYVVSGQWHDPYTAQVFTRARDLDVDHLVPLAEAHRSGAHRWSAAKRRAFANDLSDPRSLIAVDAGTNRAKGADDPSEWLPPNRNYRCAYVRDWVAVKQRWDLSMDPAERRAVDQVLATCRARGR